MKDLWQKDRLWTCTIAAWLLTVMSIFLGNAVFSVTLPAIGELFPFRIFLPATVVLYVFWLIREKRNPWQEYGNVEKLCWMLVAIMLLHSVVSLSFAIDFAFSFRRLFNLCFDLCFFVLAMRLCREKKVLLYTLLCAGGAVVALCIAGTYEAFAGGIFSDIYNELQQFLFFDKVLQFPIVTFSNTNDFASTLVFILAAVLLYWGQDYLEGRKRTWVLFALFPLCFFMAKVASARLVIMAMWILLVGLVLFFLLADKKRSLISLAILLMFLGVNFANQYRDVMPAVKDYMQSATIYLESFFQKEDGSEEEEKKPDKPNFTLPSSPDTSLKDEIFTTDSETGEKVINQESSGGVRFRLLKHALDCFIDSKGMGVGIGNTEQLAKQKFAGDKSEIWSIHCFPARIVADYGIWVLIPLCLIAYCLIARGVKQLVLAIKRKEPGCGAMGILYLIVLITYPILATSSSDAQDILAMWLYLACLVIGEVEQSPTA